MFLFQVKDDGLLDEEEKKEEEELQEPGNEESIIGIVETIFCTVHLYSLNLSCQISCYWGDIFAVYCF